MKALVIDLLEWQKCFGTEEACGMALDRQRWPKGMVALGACRDRQSEGLSAGSLSRCFVQTSAGISQRVLLPLQPPCLGTRTPHAPAQRLPDPHAGQTENCLEARKSIINRDVENTLIRSEHS